MKGRRKPKRRITVLNRKLLRDLAGMKSQGAAIGMVAAGGIASFVMALTTLASLTETMESYYDRYGFPHVFARVKRAPERLIQRIEAVPGVAVVEARVVADVSLLVPGMPEPALAHMVSLAGPGEGRSRLNQLHLRGGRTVDPNASGEVVVGEAFADAHALGPGSELRVILNGRSKRVRVVGIGLSPEATFQIQPGGLIPDAKRYGTFWMAERELEGAFDMDGAFNDVSIRLSPGASEAEVIRRVDILTARYGGTGAFGREHHISHRYLADDLRQLKAMAVVAPSIFLVVAAFLFHVVLSRLISTQREQVAVLKAFGYSDREVALHFLKFALVISIFGALIGIAGGAGFGRWMTGIYTTFYRFPSLSYSLHPWPVILAVGASLATAAAGTVFAVKRVLLLPPAEAMRPDPPAAFKRSVIDRIGRHCRLPSFVRMVFRQVVRAPLRTGLSVIGISLAGAQLILSLFFEGSLDYIIDHEFSRSRKYDVALSFFEPQHRSVLFEIAGEPGVYQTEAVRQVAAKIAFRNRSRRLVLTGLPSGRRGLHRVLDKSGREIELPGGGDLVVSAKLAEVLGFHVGDMVVGEVLEGERRVVNLRVAALVEDFTGIAAYADLDALNRLIREGDRVSGAYLTIDAMAPDLFRALKEMPAIASVNVKQAAVKNFQDTMAENLLIMKFFNVLFAGTIAFGVVYNSARVAYSERERELATMQVIGFTPAETALLFLGEQVLLVALAIPLGWVVGSGFVHLAAPAYSSEIYRIPVEILPQTYALAAASILGAAVFSSIIVARRIFRIDITTALKSQD